MGVISIRLNKDEEMMLKKLSELFHTDKSALIKRSLSDLYESMLDAKEVEKFEKRERAGKVSFVRAEDILKG